MKRSGIERHCGLTEKFEFMEVGMKILYWVLFIAAVCFCVVGFMGHTTAWGASALSFFAATMIIVGQRKNKDSKNR